MSKRKKNKDKNLNQTGPISLKTVYPQEEAETEDNEAYDASAEELSDESYEGVNGDSIVESVPKHEENEAFPETASETEGESTTEESDAVSEEAVSPESAETAEEEKTSGESGGNQAEAQDKAADEKVSVLPRDEDKKYKVNRNSLKALTESERIRREARRKRRIRQQVFAYVFLVLAILVIGCGLFFGIRFLVGRSNEKKAIAEAEALLEQQRLEAERQAAEAEELSSIIEAPVYTVADLGDTPLEQLDSEIRQTIDQMTLEEKVQGIMFVTPESLTGVDRVLIAGDGTAKALEEFCPGGIIYSAKNVNSSEQFAQMIEKTPSMAKYPIFYCMTETGLDESGLIRSGLISGAMSPKDAAATGDVNSILSVGMSIGSGLRSVGITVDFAPDCDLDILPGGIGSNATYGDDASVITPYVTGMAEGLAESGVISVYKYFPSLAASSQNPAVGRAVSERSMDDFRAQEFQVWLSAINAGASMIQMSNVIYPQVDSDMLPSSLSEKTVTGVLRDELKYDGVIISGPLNDGAITAYYTAGDSAVMALKAGCDIIFCPSDPKAAAQGIVDAVGNGVVSEERINDALVRLYRIRYDDRYDELKAQYESKAALMGVDLTGETY